MEEKQAEFEALVQAYSADLYRYAIWLCRNATLAEDLLQEAFARAWKSLDDLQDAGAAKSWLITILRREFSRHLSRKDSQNLSIEEVQQEVENLAIAEHQGHQEITLEKAIYALPIEYREPLVLQVLAGYSCDEIAELMNIKSGAVMTRLFRARQKLRQLLVDDETLTVRNSEGVVVPL